MIAMILHHFAGVLMNLGTKYMFLHFQSTGPGSYPHRSDGLQLLVNVDLCPSLFDHLEQLNSDHMTWES